MYEILRVLSPIFQIPKQKQIENFDFLEVFNVRDDKKS